MNVSWRSLMNLFYLHLVLLLQLFSQNSIQMVFTDHAYCGVIKTRSYTNFLLLIWVQYPVFICAHFHHQIAAKYYKRFSKLNLILILQGFMSASGVGIIVFMQKHRFSEKPRLLFVMWYCLWWLQWHYWLKIAQFLIIT